jgi:hypothetical protein
MKRRLSEDRQSTSMESHTEERKGKPGSEKKYGKEH